jgi:replicative DNA helicase
MTARTAHHASPRHNLDAEESILGSALYARTAAEVLARTLTPADFYRPAHASICAALLELRAQGAAIDTVTVADVLKRTGMLEAAGGQAGLLAMVANMPLSSQAPRYAEIVLRESAARRLDALLLDGREALVGGKDPYALADQVDSELNRLARGRCDPVGLLTLDDILDEPASEMPPWAIDGCLRLDERAVFVARAGSGKSVLLRQIAVCVGQGIDPFRFTQVEPLPTLILDAENSRAAIRETGEVMRRAARSVDYDPERVHIMRRPGGINLRSDRGRGELEDVLERVRPKLVLAGPMYQLSAKQRDERDDEHAVGMQKVLNDLRVRYGFALILEDHAPHSENLNIPMRPFGSSRWINWPEFGFSLKDRRTDGALIMERYRGDRLHSRWPSEFVRGETWPWEPRWPKGTFENGSKHDTGAARRCAHEVTP